MREQIGYLGDEDANLTDPVRNIVGFAAGGATGTTARLIGQCLPGHTIAGVYQRGAAGLPPTS